MSIYHNKGINKALKPWKGLHHGQTRHNDQITHRISKTSLVHSTKSTAHILGKALPSRFYTGTAIRHPNSAAVLSDRLQRYSTASTRPYRPATCLKAKKSSTFYYLAESAAKAAKKRAWDNLQARIFAHATTYGLIDEPAEASIDSTGLESHYVSRHFLMRQGKRTQKYRKWTKLTVVCHHASHLIAGAVVGVGPSNDSAYLPAAVGQAVKHLSIFRLLADAGYDTEANHKLCREQLGIRSTVIAVNDRHLKTGKLTGRYRRQMKRCFPKRKFGKRWQVESVVSRMKRRLGYSLRARDNGSRQAECLLRVLTYNLMILYLLFKKSFSYGKITSLN